jgi:hypothetical protein
MNRLTAVTLESGWAAPLLDRYYVDENNQVRLKDKLSRLGLNYPTQGNQRYLFATVIRRIIDWGYSWMLWWVMHDELLLCVPLETATLASQILKAAMTMDFHGVPIECDADGIDDDGNLISHYPYSNTWMPRPEAFNAREVLDSMNDMDDEDELVNA